MLTVTYHWVSINALPTDAEALADWLGEATFIDRHKDGRTTGRVWLHVRCEGCDPHDDMAERLRGCPVPYMSMEVHDG